jgi:alpha-1,6-mannosyltransferase
VNFYAVLDAARITGIATIGITLPVLWWRFRHTDREALMGIALVMIVVVLFVPAALPWYYTWPLAVVAPLAQSRRAIALIAGLSSWITVIWKPDGAHGMYSWTHVILATTAASLAWYSLYNAPSKPRAVNKPRPRAVNRPRPRAVNRPSPGPDEQPREPDANAARPQDAH